MGLNSSFDVAKNALDNAQRRMGAVSRNLNGASDLDYCHRTIISHTRGDGGSYTTIRRDADDALLEDYLTKSSKAHGASIYSSGVSRLNSIFNSDEFSHSPSEAIAKLKQSLQLYVNESDDRGSAEAVVSNAQSLTHSLNFASREIQHLRQDADNDIAANVKDMNQLLQKLQDVERHIVNNHSEDVNSYLDQRDAILKELSGHISITVTKHDNGSISVYAADGVTLYDKTPRAITFDRKPLSPGVPGGVIKIDGVPLTHSSFVAPNGDGSLGNLLRLRDETCVKYQKQLDLIAYNLVNMFKSGKDKNGKPLDFFQADGSKIDGMASSIHVNDKFITAKKGNPLLLGDKKNIQKIIDSLSDSSKFSYGSADAADFGFQKGGSLISFAQDSLSWVGSLVKDSKEDEEYKVTMFNHAQQALSNKTGVSQDEELSLMMDIEHSYGASAKLLSTLGKMLDDLLSSVR